MIIISSSTIEIMRPLTKKNTGRQSRTASGSAHYYHNTNRLIVIGVGGVRNVRNYV